MSVLLPGVADAHVPLKGAPLFCHVCTELLLALSKSTSPSLSRSAANRSLTAPAPSPTSKPEPQLVVNGAVSVNGLRQRMMLPTVSPTATSIQPSLSRSSRTMDTASLPRLPRVLLTVQDAANGLLGLRHMNAVLPATATMSVLPSRSISATARSAMPALALAAMKGGPQLLVKGAVAVSGLAHKRMSPSEPPVTRSVKLSTSRSAKVTEVILILKLLVSVLLTVHGVVKGAVGFCHSLTWLFPAPSVTLTMSSQPSWSKSARATSAMGLEAEPRESAEGQPPRGVPSFSITARVTPAP